MHASHNQVVSLTVLSKLFILTCGNSITAIGAPSKHDAFLQSQITAPRPGPCPTRHIDSAIEGVAPSDQSTEVPPVLGTWRYATRLSDPKRCLNISGLLSEGTAPNAAHAKATRQSAGACSSRQRDGGAGGGGTASGGGGAGGGGIGVPVVEATPASTPVTRKRTERRSMIIFIVWALCTCASRR